MSLFRTRNVVLFVVVLVLAGAVALAAGTRLPPTDLANSQGVSRPNQSRFPSPQPQPTAVVPDALPTVHAAVPVYPTPTPRPPRPWPTPDATQLAARKIAGEKEYAFYEQPGTVIAEGTNTTPVKGTTLGITLTSYRITEVVLPAPVTWEVTAPSADSGLLTSQPLTLNRLWRIEIIGEVFLGSMMWTVWIDNQAVGLGRTTEQGLETVMFDDKYLREGAVLAVAYGGPGSGIREEVPERLHLLNR